MRIVLDTNDLISGLLLKEGPSGELLRLWTDGEFLLVTSPYQLDELRRVMNYDRLRGKILPEEIRLFFDNIDAKALVVTDAREVDYSPDPEDNPILGMAIAGRADLIVSGDKNDMVSLGQVEGIPIKKARDALALLRGR